MSGQKTNGELTKTLRFIIREKKGQRPILERMTARHTFGVIKNLEVLSQFDLDSLPTTGELDELTITTKGRLVVKFDLKAETGLNTSFLQQCGRQALQMMSSFRTKRTKWEWRRDSASSSTIMRILSEIELSLEGEITKRATEIKEAIETFSETRLWRRLRRNKPSLPLQSKRYKSKKIPIFLTKVLLLPFQEEGVISYHKIEEGRLYIKLATLKKRQAILLELGYGDYHLRELEQGRITGGRIVKNLDKNRWEFHASIRKTIPESTAMQKRKQAILGIDLGIVTDATIAVLLERDKLAQDRFFFLKEPELRKKKFNIDQRKKVLQRIKDTTTGKKRKKVVEELQNISHNYEQVTNEACHRIAKRVAAIARKYLEEDYEVHVAIGQLKGLRKQAQKGDWKGKKFRGKINRFPFWKLTKYISYKCREVGVPEENIREIKESWTSKTCHKCGSTNTKRPTQASFECLNCGLQYNADLNGAINIALRYWMNKTERSSKEVKMIFLSSRSNKHKRSEGLSKSVRPLLKPLGTSDSPPCDESTGEGLVVSNPNQLKVEEAGKRKRFLEHLMLKSESRPSRD